MHDSNLLMAKQRLLLSQLFSITYGDLNPRSVLPVLQPCPALWLSPTPLTLSTSDGERKTPQTYLSPENYQGS